MKIRPTKPTKPKPKDPHYTDIVRYFKNPEGKWLTSEEYNEYIYNIDDAEWYPEDEVNYEDLENFIKALPLGTKAKIGLSLIDEAYYGEGKNLCLITYKERSPEDSKLIEIENAALLEKYNEDLEKYNSETDLYNLERAERELKEAQERVNKFKRKFIE